MTVSVTKFFFRLQKLISPTTWLRFKSLQLVLFSCHFVLPGDTWILEM